MSKKNCNPALACTGGSCRNDEPIIEEPTPLDSNHPKWGEMADSFVMVTFAVGVYSQVFAFFMYAFAS
ncbi:hypothetical protein COT94_00515 [Candidatus Falkowbacteria bacterium CG10_big_fil_rev_8_21_14_0_10_37_14]|uniref:Uncharacterized protein n=1 Tax=Candidatus Falkowbacteria bacterium CG10_big_fil_rev_8_21_14_0_10_37_14 TaxID=1974561 RepID=A0A2M6WUL2_9BACT|nr:hypothetical protein [Candidatus Falkowbacteria bacterium]OIO47220.1 MAG: hypothetical protein AUJ28_01080 [Parcubacteria group bacterium CG1_02_37_51]PIT96431.1 MAG: hypothetical protein COT94_00515 [Candidatus Falkowbacteria bacterium CG10_big_fil_rev_8_21_14_0_10_37_14]